MAEDEQGGKEDKGAGSDETNQEQDKTGQEAGDDKGKGGAGDDSAKSWLATSGLSDETLKDPSLQNFLKDENPQKFFDSHLSLRKMIGNSIQIPGKDATPEQIEAYKDKFRPEKTEGQSPYQYTAPENMPNPELFSQEILTEVQEKFYEAGISQEHFSKAMEIYDDVIKTFGAQGEQNAADAEISCKETLQKDPKWRGAGYARNEALCKAGADYLFGGDPKSESRSFLDGAKLIGSNPHFMQAMNKLGRAIAEGGGEEGKLRVEELSDLTSADAGEEIKAVQTDKNHRYHKAYNDSTDPKHGEAKTYVKKLYALKSPGNVTPPEFVGPNK